MITLKSLKLNNFLSHSNTELEFQDGQKLLIDGKSGSGKSSIIDAIIWCLYGRSRVDNNRHLIKHGHKSASVTVVLSDDAIEYKVTRTVSTIGKHVVTIEKDGAEVMVAGVKGANEYIENEILRSSYLLFINSIAYPQDNVENFVKQPAEKRKDIIMEIIRASAYDRYYDKARDAMATRQTKMSEAGGRIHVYKDDLAKALVLCQDLPELRLKAQNTVNEVFSLKKVVDDLSMAVSITEGKRGSLEVVRHEGATLLAKVNEKKAEIEKLKVLQAALASIDTKVLKREVDRIPGVQAQIKELRDLELAAVEWSEKYTTLLREAVVQNDYKAMIDELDDQMVTIAKEEIELCPELNKACPILEKKQQARMAELGAKIEELYKKKNKQDNDIRERDKQLRELGSQPLTDRVALDKLSGELSRLIEVKGQYELAVDKQRLDKEYTDGIAGHEAEIVTLYGKIASNSFKEQELSSEIDKLLEMKTDWAEKKYSLENKENELHHYQTEIAIKEQSERRAGELKAIINEIENNNKDLAKEMEDLALLKEAFGPKGIKAMVVDYVIPRLEAKINDILGQLSDFTVKLETQRSGVKDETILEGLFITIINARGEEFDYQNYSGGEKLKITVAITEALAEIQKISFRLLDELFVGLDEESTEGFVNVMQTLNSRFSQMLCVTHLRDIKETFQEKVTVVNINGTSTTI